MEFAIIAITPTCLTLETPFEKRPLRFPLRQPLPEEFKVGDMVFSEIKSDIFAQHVAPKQNSGYYDLTHMPSGIRIRIPHSDYFLADGRRRTDY